MVGQLQRDNAITLKNDKSHVDHLYHLVADRLLVLSVIISYLYYR